MIAGDLDHLNRVIGHSGAEWLGEAYRPAFDKLVGEIRALRRADDDFEIVPFAAPHAWQTNWVIFQALRRRPAAGRPPDKRTDDEKARDDELYRKAFERQRTEELWTRYLNERTELVKAIQSGGAGRRDAITYLGLEESDLDDPNSLLGVRPENWMKVATRISSALPKWQRLNADDRAFLPLWAAAIRANVTSERFGAFVPQVNETFKKLIDRVAALEEYCATLGQPKETQQ
jgi:hypothetical protein